MKHALAIPMLACLIGLVSCRASDSAGSKCNPDDRPYYGPPVAVEIHASQADPPQHEALIEVVAPTGGWKLQIDRSDVQLGIATIYATLEKPASDEMVTQAIVSHRQRFISQEPFDTARVYVFVAERGFHYLTPDYRLAATAPSSN